MVLARLLECSRSDYCLVLALTLTLTLILMLALGAHACPIA